MAILKCRNWASYFDDLRTRRKSDVIGTNLKKKTVKFHFLKFFSTKKLILSQFEESEDSVIRYQLRNRTVSIPNIEHKGLGPNPEIQKTKKGHGRNSHLYKAQSRALVDIASGRQKSIIGVLRAAKTLDRVLT
jgi:hypothetical protein